MMSEMIGVCLVGSILILMVSWVADRASARAMRARSEARAIEEAERARLVRCHMAFLDKQERWLERRENSLHDRERIAAERTYQSQASVVEDMTRMTRALAEPKVVSLRDRVVAPAAAPSPYDALAQHEKEMQDFMSGKSGGVNPTFHVPPPVPLSPAYASRNGVSHRVESDDPTLYGLPEDE